MVLYSEENGNLENTDQGIRITVESFSPFALFWEEDSGGNGGHGGNGGNKPSLNTEDHYGYIVGYPVDYETGEPTDDQARKPVKPQGKITRAEAVTMVNRTLDRHPDQDHFLEDMLVWPDNLDTEAWYYADIQEATNSHEYQVKKDAQGNEYEVWTKILPIRDWEALEKEWSDANSSENPGDVV